MYVTHDFFELLGNLQPHRGLLRRLLPNNEVDSGRNTDVTLMTDVPRSEREEMSTAAAAAESTDGSDVSNTAENVDHLADDAQNMVDVHDARDVATIRRLRQLRKQLSSQVIQRKWQFLCLHAYSIASSLMITSGYATWFTAGGAIRIALLQLWQITSL